MRKLLLLILLLAIPAQAQQVRGLQFWGDSTSLVTSGTTTSIVSWNDRSPAGNHLNITSSTAPVVTTVGSTRVYQGANARWLSRTLTTSTWPAVSVHAVVRIAAVANTNEPVIAFGSGSLAQFVATGWSGVSALTYRSSSLAVVRDAVVLEDDAWHLCSWTLQGTTFSSYVDGALVDQVTVAANLTVDAFRLGDYNLAASFNGLLAEVVIADVAHSPAEVLALWRSVKIRHQVDLMPSPSRLVAFVGDSMTVPFSGTSDSYMSQTMDALASAHGTRDWFFTAGAASKTAQDLQGIYSEGVMALSMESWRCAQRKVCVVWAGTNDIFLGGTAAAAHASLAQLCVKLGAAGYVVVVVTVLPRVADNDTKRADLNALIAANYSTYAAALADVAADDDIGDDGDEANATYYMDQVHLTDAGNAKVAAILLPHVEAALGF